MSSDTLKIGVLSDTHLPDSVEAHEFLLDIVENVLAPVDMILHAGDLVSPDLHDVFSEYPFHIVRGNMDPAARGVPHKKVINVEGYSIGLIHGWGPSDGLEERVYGEFSAVSLDCLVYGHSHTPACHYRDGILFFNPGSPTDRRGMAFHSVGLLEIDTEVRGTIIRLD